MNAKVVPSHVAILVPSVRKAAEALKKYDFKIEPEQEWENEGTREIYVEKNRSNSLLLVEPIKQGPYERALKKRGPGLHHVAVDVLNLEEFLAGIASSGWLLHLSSLKSIKEFRTAYLARPGFPGLIEVQEKQKLLKADPFVKSIGVPLEKDHKKLIESIGLKFLFNSSKNKVFFQLGEVKIHLKTLIGKK